MAVTDKTPFSRIQLQKWRRTEQQDGNLATVRWAVCVVTHGRPSRTNRKEAEV